MTPATAAFVVSGSRHGHVLALPARTNKGESRIVPGIKQFAGVVTTRAHIHYVVTEYGIADLFGRSIRERARQLIALAHPDDREALERLYELKRLASA